MITAQQHNRSFNTYQRMLCVVLHAFKSARQQLRQGQASCAPTAIRSTQPRSTSRACVDAFELLACRGAAARSSRLVSHSAAAAPVAARTMMTTRFSVVLYLIWSVLLKHTHRLFSPTFRHCCTTQPRVCEPWAAGRGVCDCDYCVCGSRTGCERAL